MQDWSKFQQRKPAHKLLKSSKVCPKLHSSWATISLGKAQGLRCLCDHQLWPSTLEKQDALGLHLTQLSHQKPISCQPRRLVSRPRRLQQNSAITASFICAIAPNRCRAPCTVWQVRFALSCLQVRIGRSAHRNYTRTMTFSESFRKNNNKMQQVEQLKPTWPPTRI